MVEFKPGDRAVYHEDGGWCVVEVLEYFKDTHEEKAKIRVLEVECQPLIGPEWTVGEEHEVWHVIDAGGWGGDWRLREYGG